MGSRSSSGGPGLGSGPGNSGCSLNLGPGTWVTWVRVREFGNASSDSGLGFVQISGRFREYPEFGRFWPESSGFRKPESRNCSGPEKPRVFHKYFPLIGMG